MLVLEECRKRGRNPTTVDTMNPAHLRAHQVPASLLGPVAAHSLADVPCAGQEPRKGAICAHLSGQQLLALHQGSPRLHKVVHNDDVAPPRLALLQPHNPLVAVPHLGADDLQQKTKMQLCLAVPVPGKLTEAVCVAARACGTHTHPAGNQRQRCLCLPCPTLTLPAE